MPRPPNGLYLGCLLNSKDSNNLNTRVTSGFIAMTAHHARNHYADLHAHEREFLAEPLLST